MINDSDFAEGFRQGFRAIRGTSVHLPHLPHQPHTKYGRTAFQMGIMRGIERGKDWDSGDLLDKNSIS